MGKNYQHAILNSNEPLTQNGGTKEFINYAKEHGFDLNDYGATTWQIRVKGTSDSSADILSKPAIYWTSEVITDEMVDKKVNVPVMGYRDGKYDVYYAAVVTHNKNSKNQYNALAPNLANVTESGGSATFQFDNYQEAKEAYDKLLKIYNTKHTIDRTDIVDNGLDK